MPTPIAPADTDAAHRMWREYTAAFPQSIGLAEEPVIDHFGDSAELGDELLGLVLTAGKRATATLLGEFAHWGEPLPRIGGHWIACDGAGVPRAILRTTELRIGVTDSVDDAFARDEAEDDGSRDSWLEQHRRYWQRVSATSGIRYDEHTEVVFERFSVVWPPEVAD